MSSNQTHLIPRGQLHHIIFSHFSSQLSYSGGGRPFIMGNQLEMMIPQRHKAFIYTKKGEKDPSSGLWAHSVHG